MALCKKVGKLWNKFWRDVFFIKDALILQSCVTQHELFSARLRNFIRNEIYVHSYVASIYLGMLLFKSVLNLKHRQVS